MSGTMPTMQQMSAPQMSPLPPGPGAAPGTPGAPGNMPMPRPPMMPQGMPPQQPMMPPGGMQPPMPQQLQAQAQPLQSTAPQLMGGVASPPAQHPAGRNVPVQNLSMLGKAAQMRADQIKNQNPSSKLRLTPAELAGLGRFGDTIVAHLTPGEIAVPPQVQTPQLMQVLQQAFQAAHVNVDQFTAGSKQSSINPQTGMPEYNFLSGLLGPALGLAGSILAPEIGVPAWLLGGAGGALGGALGGGGLQGALLGGLTGGVAGGLGLGDTVGGWLGMGSSGAAAGAGTGVGSAMDSLATNDLTQFPSGYITPPIPPGTQGADAATSTTPVNAATDSTNSLGTTPSTGASVSNANNSSNMGDWLSRNKSWLPLGIGGLGAILAATSAMNSQTAPLPAGFSSPLAPRAPNPNALLGNGANATPSFTGYNPIASVTQKPFNFFTPSANG